MCLVSGCMKDVQGIWPHIHEHATLALINVVLASRWLGRPGKDVERICDASTWTEAVVKSRREKTGLPEAMFFFWIVYCYSGQCRRIRVLPRGMVQTWWRHIIHYCFVSLFHVTFERIWFKRAVTKRVTPPRFSSFASLPAEQAGCQYKLSDTSGHVQCVYILLSMCAITCVYAIDMILCITKLALGIGKLNGKDK